MSDSKQPSTENLVIKTSQLGRPAIFDKVCHLRTAFLTTKTSRHHSLEWTSLRRSKAKGWQEAERRTIRTLRRGSFQQCWNSKVTTTSQGRDHSSSRPSHHHAASNGFRYARTSIWPTGRWCLYGRCHHGITRNATSRQSSQRRNNHLRLNQMEPIDGKTKNTSTYVHMIDQLTLTNHRMRRNHFQDSPEAAIQVTVTAEHGRAGRQSTSHSHDDYHSGATWRITPQRLRRSKNTFAITRPSQCIPENVNYLDKPTNLNPQEHRPTFNPRTLDCQFTVTFQNGHMANTLIDPGSELDIMSYNTWMHTQTTHG